MALYDTMKISTRSETVVLDVTPEEMEKLQELVSVKEVPLRNALATVLKQDWTGDILREVLQPLGQISFTIPIFKTLSVQHYPQFNPDTLDGAVWNLRRNDSRLTAEQRGLEWVFHWNTK